MSERARSQGRKAAGGAGRQRNKDLTCGQGSPLGYMGLCA